MGHEETRANAKKPSTGAPRPRCPNLPRFISAPLYLYQCAVARRQILRLQDDIEASQGVYFFLLSPSALKDAVIASYTPVDSEDEENEEDCVGENLGHNPPMFFDAVEDLSGVLPVVEIAV